MSKLEELIQQLCPNGVECISLGRIGNFENVGVDKKVVEGQPLVTLLNYMDVYRNMYIDNNIPKMIVSAAANKIQDCSCEKGDIFVTPTSETKQDIGHAAVVTETLVNTVYSYHIMRFRLNNKSMTTSCYIRYLFESELVQRQIFKLSKGLTRFGLSKYDFAKIEIPLPPLPVQEEIVRILDAFTSHAAELQAELQARREQYEYYRNKLLSFEDDSSVEWKKLGEICDNYDRRRKPVTASNRKPGPYPYYGASGIVDYVDSFIFDGDFLLISEDGANLLTRNMPIAFSIKGKNWVNNHAHILKFSDMVTQKLVEYYINMIDVSQYVSGGAQPKLNQENLNKILIPIPPLSEQQRIVAILDKFEALVNDLTEGLPAEIAARQEQYEYYRDRLLSFPKAV